jgi:S-(hydroxymethyl)glutathione dehydrogenase/alcohol dehydrogenase
LRTAIAYETGAPLVLEDHPVPEVGERDVRVRLTASGICHTDLTVIDGLSALSLPRVIGHEGCGIVEQVGSKVERVKVGARVLASVSPACNRCWWCLNGLSNHCELKGPVSSKPRFTGRDGQPVPALCGCGTFGEQMVVDEASVVAVQTDLPDEQLALLGCGVTTGVGAALNTAAVTPGSSVSVIGCGGVGQSIVQGARIAGAATIIAIDLDQGRRDAALKAGATHAIDPADGPALEQVRALTDGRGVDFSFEAVGHPDLIVQAVDLARAAGSVVIVGMPARETEIRLPAVSTVFSGKRIQGSVVGGAQILRDFPRFVRLVESGRLDLGSMVSHTIGLGDINEGIDRLRNAEGVRTVVLNGAS